MSNNQIQNNNQSASAAPPAENLVNRGENTVDPTPHNASSVASNNFSNINNFGLQNVPVSSGVGNSSNTAGENQANSFANMQNLTHNNNLTNNNGRPFDYSYNNNNYNFTPNYPMNVNPPGYSGHSGPYQGQIPYPAAPWFDGNTWQIPHPPQQHWQGNWFSPQPFPSHRLESSTITPAANPMMFSHQGSNANGPPPSGYASGSGPYNSGFQGPGQGNNNSAPPNSGYHGQGQGLQGYNAGSGAFTNSRTDWGRTQGAPPNRQMNSGAPAYNTNLAKAIEMVAKMYPNKYSGHESSSTSAAEWLAGLIRAINLYANGLSSPERIAVACASLTGTAETWVRSLNIASQRNLAFMEYQDEDISARSLRRYQRNSFVGLFLARFPNMQTVDQFTTALATQLRTTPQEPKALLELIISRRDDFDEMVTDDRVWAILTRSLPEKLLHDVQLAQVSTYRERERVHDYDWLASQAQMLYEVFQRSTTQTQDVASSAPKTEKKTGGVPIAAIHTSRGNQSESEMLRTEVRNLTRVMGEMQQQLLGLRSVVYENITVPGYSAQSPYPEQRGYTTHSSFVRPRNEQLPSPSPIPPDVRPFVADRHERNQEHRDPEPNRLPGSPASRMVPSPMGATPLRSTPTPMMDPDQGKGPAPTQLAFGDSPNRYSRNTREQSGSQTQPNDWSTRRTRQNNFSGSNDGNRTYSTRSSNRQFHPQHRFAREDMRRIANISAGFREEVTYPGIQEEYQPFQEEDMEDHNDGQEFNGAEVEQNENDDGDQNKQFDPGGKDHSPFPIPLGVCIRSTMVLKSDPSFTIPATFTTSEEKTVSISALIDTGADFSVLNSVIFRRLGLNIEDYVDRRDLAAYQCYDAQGQSMHVVGVLSRPIAFQLRADEGTLRTFTIEPNCTAINGFQSVTVICDSCPFPVLLGWPLLGHHNFTVNPATLSIEADGFIFAKSNKLTGRIQRYETKSYDAFSMHEPGTIPALSSVLVPIWVPELPTESTMLTTLVLTPDDKLEETTGLVFTATALDRSNPQILITNTNCFPTDMPVLQYLGTAQEYFRQKVSAINLGKANKNTLSPTVAAVTKEHTDPLPTVHESIPAEYRSQFEDLVQHYKDIFHNDFSTDSWDTPAASIELKPGARPFHANPFRLPAAHQEAMRTIIEKFIKEGVVVPSNSPWAAPCFLVPKPGGALRFVIDYRVLNGFTTRCHWPLPNIEDLLMRMSHAKVFSVFDAHTGFHQMPLDKEAQYLTSFIAPFGQFMYTRLPMGLANAPSLFMRGMSDFTRDLMNVVVFVDDITVYNGAEAHTTEALYRNHLRYLTSFFAKCRAKHLKLNGKKSTIGAPEINYLGHRINAAGIFPAPSKVDAVQSFAQPSNVTQVKQFLGIVNYYRQWIPQCAKLQLPLNMLTRKDVDFHWTEECEHSFQTLKAGLTNDCVRRFPDPNLTYHLETDSSDYAIGAVLSQRGVDQTDDRQVISYYSRCLSGAELNYSAYEKECLAIVAAITYYRPYLATEAKFYVHTDHRSLATVLSWKNPPRRIARWLATLTEYSFQTIYRPGPQNANADALSRLPSKYVSLPDESLPAQITCRDGNWQTEGKFDRDDAGHLTVKVTALRVADRRAPRVPRRAGPRPEARTVPAVEEAAALPPSTPVSDTAAGTGRKVDADELFNLYGRIFVDAESGWRYKIADVVFDAVSGTFTGLRIAMPPTPFDTPDEWLPLEYFTRNLSALESPVRFEHAVDTFRIDGEFRAAVETELPTLFQEQILYAAAVVLLPDERNQYHYYRQWIDRKAHLLHLQLILPSTDTVIKAALLRSAHDEHGHMGVTKTYRRLRQVVFWRHMRKDIEEYIQSCDICEMKGKATDRAHDPKLILRHPPVYRPFQRVSVDLIGPLPESYTGHKHVVVMVDHFTKWVITRPICSKEAEQVAEALIQALYMVHGPAEVLLADNGSEITANQVNAHVFQRLGSHLTNTTGYHPASNGQVERINRILKEAIAKYTDDKDHRDWDRLLPLVTHSINTSVSSATGYSPYLLLYGRECRLSMFDLLPNVQDFSRLTTKQRDYLHSLTHRLEVMQSVAAQNIEVGKSLYNKPGVYHRALHLLEEENSPLYTNGTKVLIYTPAVKEHNVKKLSKFWHGPYIVTSCINMTTYVIDMGGKLQPMHVSRMKPFMERPPKFRTATRPLLI